MQKYCDENSVEYSINEPLSKHTSFKIGGDAAIFISPSSPRQIADLIGLATSNDVRYIFLGKGSNVLFRDSGYDGAIINIGKNLSKISLIDDSTIYCEAGMPLSKLCLFAMENSLTGLEFAYGIPGSVGGAAYMNAGAYGGEMKDALVQVRYIDENGNVKTAENDELDFSYRHSLFTDSGKCILGCTFKLDPGDKSEIKSKMDDFIHRRQTKQPLDFPSGGSTFKRPEGAYASALIDQCGLKGMRVGGAMVSKKHAGFVINYNNATCQDVLDLVEKVKRIVKDKTGFTLECEIKII